MADDTTAGSSGSVTAGVFGGEQEINAFADDAKRLLTSAQAGEWALDEETGTHIIYALKAAQETHAQLEPRMRDLQRAPMLGKDGYAQKVAKHFLDSMNSDEQSLLVAIKRFREGLDNARRAFETAIRNYRASDETAGQQLGHFKDRGTA